MSSQFPRVMHLAAAKQDAKLGVNIFFLPRSSLWILAWLLSSGFVPGGTIDCQEKLRATAACLPLIIFSTGPCYAQIFVGLGNPLSGKLLKRPLLYCCCRRNSLSPGWEVLGSSLSSETRLYVTSAHYFTLLGFYLYIELDSDKGVKRTLPYLVSRNRERVLVLSIYLDSIVLRALQLGWRDKNHLSEG